MKRVIFALGAVVVLGCVEQPSSRPVSQRPRATVFDELALSVEQTLASKTVEDNRLAQYGVEKQRLVSRLLPNGDFADGHLLAIEGYVSQRDPEAANPAASPTGGISFERFFRRQPSGALMERAQIIPLLPFPPASVARNLSFYTSFLWEGVKPLLKVGGD